MKNILESYSGLAGVYFKAPIADADINKLEEVFGARSSSALAQEYIDFMLFSDGVQIDNVVLDSLHNVLGDQPKLSENIVIGCNGNVEAFILKADKSQFQSVNVFDHKDVFCSFSSLNDLLVYVLKTQGIVSSA